MAWFRCGWWRFADCCHRRENACPRLAGDGRLASATPASRGRRQACSPRCPKPGQARGSAKTLPKVCVASEPFDFVIGLEDLKTLLMLSVAPTQSPFGPGGPGGPLLLVPQVEESRWGRRRGRSSLGSPQSGPRNSSSVPTPWKLRLCKVGRTPAARSGARPSQACHDPIYLRALLNLPGIKERQSPVIPPPGNLCFSGVRVWVDKGSDPHQATLLNPPFFLSLEICQGRERFQMSFTIIWTVCLTVWCGPPLR